jgi:hypothetical protein
MWELTPALAPNQPAVQLAKNFLRTGKLPAPMNDTRVTVYHTGMKLAAVADPYMVATGEIAGDIDSA